MSEAIYAKPDMTKKVKFDRGETEERIVDIYVSADTLRDHETSTKTEDVEHTSTKGPGDQHTGWNKFESCWYFVSTKRKTWSESRMDCLERGADLVIINSREEQRFLFSLNKGVWIGLTDNKTEGSWKWVDGTPLNTSYWGSNQPSKAGGHSTNQEKDCVELQGVQDQPEKTWNYLKCDKKLNWICEKCNK
ncbi:CD209 antigen-like protein E isoform X3 [Salvelinus alpinus]|uniref:CD209 antigen-like protein E isoform X3 n=1 Tax=Salvelinus alpinus TaxID=8036 RepID=UPI0039FCA263